MSESRVKFSGWSTSDQFPNVLKWFGGNLGRLNGCWIRAKILAWGFKLRTNRPSATCSLVRYPSVNIDNTEALIIRESEAWELLRTGATEDRPPAPGPHEHMDRTVAVGLGTKRTDENRHCSLQNCPLSGYIVMSVQGQDENHQDRRARGPRRGPQSRPHRPQSIRSGPVRPTYDRTAAYLITISGSSSGGIFLPLSILVGVAIITGTSHHNPGKVIHQPSCFHLKTYQTISCREFVPSQPILHHHISRFNSAVVNSRLGLTRAPGNKFGKKAHGVAPNTVIKGNDFIYVVRQIKFQMTWPRR